MASVLRRSDPEVASAAEVVELVAHSDHLQGRRELVRHVGQVRASALNFLAQPSRPNISQRYLFSCWEGAGLDEGIHNDLESANAR